MVWRTLFVVTTTVISMLLPFFGGVVSLLGAFAFWPLTVYFPVEMYISQKKIPKWSTRWLCLQTLSVACLIISITAAAGAIAAISHDVKTTKPFHTSY
ncbi:AMINO ACID CARRIER [Salix viminalis]|uniref:AMINO ACID CARRIER n=1 Tax=Salix viminalis TaxID=40686 RepID=A0A9Q0UT17_SALVM|nr:AMINO ACID CARRIER [Salix viminalis]